MNLSRELMRKSLHFLLVLIPIFYLELGKWKSVAILVAISLPVISFDYLRRKYPAINQIFVKILKPVLREHELSGEKLSGASFVALAACVNFLLFKPAIAITAFLILAISDGFAALIGKSFPSRPFFEKSLYGSLAFFVSSLILVVGCGIFFDMQFWFYFFGLFALTCVTIIEARPTLLGIDDNFLIPISFSVIMTFFDLMWNYQY